jgi:hypothetical protein
MLLACRRVRHASLSMMPECCVDIVRAALLKPALLITAPATYFSWITGTLYSRRIEEIAPDFLSICCSIAALSSGRSFETPMEIS